MGKHAEAERILASPLADVIEATRAGKRITPSLVDQAASFRRASRPRRARARGRTTSSSSIRAGPHRARARDRRALQRDAQGQRDRPRSPPRVRGAASRAAADARSRGALPVPASRGPRASRGASLRPRTRCERAAASRMDSRSSSSATPSSSRRKIAGQRRRRRDQRGSVDARRADAAARLARCETRADRPSRPSDGGARGSSPRASTAPTPTCSIACGRVASRCRARRAPSDRRCAARPPRARARSRWALVAARTGSRPRARGSRRSSRDKPSRGACASHVASSPNACPMLEAAACGKSAPRPASPPRTS